MLRTRVLTSVVAIPVVLSAVYVGGWVLSTVVAALALLAALELRRLALAAGAHWVCPVGVAAAPVAVILAMLGPVTPGLVIVVTTLVTLGWALARQAPPRESALGAASTIAISVYAGALPALFVLLRATPGTGAPSGGIDAGLAWTLYALAVTWVCDALAYFGGRAIGRRPFFAHVSPRKTAEGAAIGLAGAIGVGVLAAPYLGLSWPIGLTLGALCGVAAEAGDLAESLLKRAAEVKDSGTLFPGHGGVLDRVDSLLFVAVVTWISAQVSGAVG